MTPSTLWQSFVHVAEKRAAKAVPSIIEDPEWGPIQLQNDLRKVAATLFDEAGLTKSQHDLMLDHSPGDMRDLYIISELKRIREQLDRHELRGKTWEELSGGGREAARG